jgi:N-acetylneuraminic acid mutarotase
MPTGRVVISAGVVNNKIYVIGGSADGFNKLAVNEAYDPLTDTWETKTPMPTPRNFLSTAVVDSIIYTIGGNWNTEGSKTVEAYNPVSDTWSQKQNTLSSRYGASACAVDGIIYNVGGNHFKSYCDAYDPQTDSWSEKAAVPETEGGIIVTAYNGLVYAFGGGYNKAFSTLYAYDPKTDSWTKKKDMPTARATLQTCLVNGKIYALGGYLSIYGGISTAVEVYDPASDSWEKKLDMPTKRAMFATGVVNDKIYVIGGTTNWSAGALEVWEYDPSFHTDIAAGNVSGKWSRANSPYFINGEVTIPNDSTLTIEPGVEVVFMGHYKFNVQGRLLAVGTKKDSIRFTAEDKNIGWHGIRFDNTPGSNDTSRIAYCSFRYGKANTGVTYDRCGGAIFINKFNKVLVSNSSFELNLNSGNMNTTGGAAIGILYASPVITNNKFLNNRGTSDGAILSAYNSSPAISNNVFLYNTSAWGTIICTDGGKPIINGNTISNNLASNYYAGAAGILIQNNTNSHIENNIITNNKVIGNYPTFAGGVCLFVNVKAVLINNIIAFNSADFGGGIEISQNSNSILINNTIIYNTGKSGGGIFFRGNSDAIFINNILFGNTASNGNEIFIEDVQSDPHFLYCDIQGGMGGFVGPGSGPNYTGLFENNIDVDPLFKDTSSMDYNLSELSLCIGKGVDSVEILGKWYYTPQFDFNGNPRPSPAGSNPDIGAFESLLNNPYVGIDQKLLVPNKITLYQNYPNPFNSKTVIQFVIPELSFITIKVFDITGKEISCLVSEEKPAGTSEVTWHAGNLPGGVYFYQLNAGGIIETKKMILRK